jgi:hypothetical protein
MDAPFLKSLQTENLVFRHANFLAIERNVETAMRRLNLSWSLCALVECPAHVEWLSVGRHAHLDGWKLFGNYLGVSRIFLGEIGIFWTIFELFLGC